MKIAILHQTMGLVSRGSEISTDIVATALSKRHEVMVIQAGSKKPNATYLAKRVATLKAPPVPAPTNLLQKILFRLHQDFRSRSVREFSLEAIIHLKKFHPDLIIATNGGEQVRLLRKHLPASKIVVFGRAGIGHDDLANLRANPDLFVALSEDARAWAESNRSINTQVVYIPNPISPKKYKKIDLSLPSPIVLTVGALSAYKNHASVIRALSLLNASLLLVGDGEESGNIAQLLSAYPGDFRWLKAVEPEDIGSYYASSDIFCFVPDKQESFGRVYLEAMASGLPIVASDDEIRRSIIGEQGIYVDPHNIESIAQGIVSALSLAGKIDYSNQIKPYKVTTVIKDIEKAFYDLIKN